jgi:fructooligosaccharide transport system substrate-binding protein
MFRKKFWIVLSVLMIFSLILAACGGAATEPVAEEPAQEESAAEETEQEAAEEDQAEEVEQEQVILDFWIPAGRGRDEGMAAVVEAFEAQHPNIKVEISAFPWGEYLNSLKVALAGNDPPDVSYTNGVEIQGLAYNGALLALDDMVTEEDREDFMDDLIQMVSLNGKMYGIPFANAANAMYYNVDYFEEAGVEVPKTLAEGWTWPEFVENVNKVRDVQAENGNEIWGTISLNNPIQATFFGWTIIRSNAEPGDPLWQGIAEDWVTVEGFIDTPQAMEAYEFYQSLYEDGFAPKESIPDAFETGKSATYFAIPPTGSTLNRNFPELNWDVMPMPYLKTPMTHTGSFAPTIAAKTDNPEAAKTFVKFLTSKEGYITYHEVTANIPGRKSLKDELPEFQEGYLAFLFGEMVEWGVARPGGPAHTIFNQIIATEMLVNIATGTEIDQAVDAAISEADAQLSQFK